MKKQLEFPFEYLKRRDGLDFSRETVENWYKARFYVLEKLKDVAIGPESHERLHVAVLGDSPLMLSVIRHVALYAHYANYDEHMQNRTEITLESKNRDIVECLTKDEYLCNLLDLCKYSIYGEEPVNADSYIDIELRVVEQWQTDDAAIQMSEEDVQKILGSKAKEEVFGIDTRKAVLAQRMYSLGALIDNLPDDDIHCADRYALALDVFKHKLRKRIKPMVKEDEWKKSQIAVRSGLSDVYCSDCFESKMKGMQSVGSWEDCNLAISNSEHLRWVVEKLILGFRPLTEQERLHDEQLFGSAKKQYRNQLKNDPSIMAHVDLCSCADLRRINPDDMKYDSFLMLAIPRIMKRLGYC